MYIILGYCTVVNTYAQTLASVTSPDGSIVLQINGKDNNLSYNVKKGVIQFWLKLLLA